MLSWIGFNGNKKREMVICDSFGCHVKRHKLHRIVYEIGVLVFCGLVVVFLFRQSLKICDDAKLADGESQMLWWGLVAVLYVVERCFSESVSLCSYFAVRH